VSAINCTNSNGADSVVKNCTIVARGAGTQMFPLAPGPGVPGWFRFHHNTVTLRDVTGGAGGYLRGVSGPIKEAWGNTWNVIDTSWASHGTICYGGNAVATYVHGDTFHFSGAGSTRVFLCDDDAGSNCWFVHNKLDADTTSAPCVLRCRNSRNVAMGFNQATGEVAVGWSFAMVGSVPAVHDVFLYENAVSGWGYGFQFEEPCYFVRSWNNRLESATTHAVYVNENGGGVLQDIVCLDDRFTGAGSLEDVALGWNDGGTITGVHFKGCTDKDGNALTVKNTYGAIPGVGYLTDQTTPAASGTKPFLGKTPNPPTNVVATEVANP
jgi:hypothetical protein